MSNESINSDIFREELIKQIKDAGQDVIDRAEDLVGNGDFLSDFDIWLRFGRSEAPTIEVTRSHIIKRYYHRMIGEN